MVAFKMYALHLTANRSSGETIGIGSIGYRRILSIYPSVDHTMMLPVLGTIWKEFNNIALVFLYICH